MCVCLVTQSCTTLWDPMDSLQLSAAHQASLSLGILQARKLEWVAMSFSRGSSQLRDQTQVFHIAEGFFNDQAKF